MSDKTNFEKVQEFHKAFEQIVQTEPKFPSKSDIKLRIKLIHEEYRELLEGIVDNNIVEVADALADLLYVVYGTADVFGINIDECFDEVHRSNMTKLGEDGKPLRNDYGKFIKGPFYTPPDLKKILFKE